jgi:hypothetical protein
MSIYQSSTKVLEVKEEAVQPCTKEKDYPSAEDRTADYRTTEAARTRLLRAKPATDDRTRHGPQEKLTQHKFA